MHLSLKPKPLNPHTSFLDPSNFVKTLPCQIPNVETKVFGLNRCTLNEHNYGFSGTSSIVHSSISCKIGIGDSIIYTQVANCDY